MLNCDFLGISAVSAHISQSGLTKFIIYKTSSFKLPVPVFEFTENEDNNNAIRSFESWANNVLSNGNLNNQVYEMELFNDFQTYEYNKKDGDVETSATGNRLTKQTKKKKLSKFNFCLSPDYPVNYFYNQPGLKRAIAQPDEQPEHIQQKVNETLKLDDVKSIVNGAIESTMKAYISEFEKKQEENRILQAFDTFNKRLNEIETVLYQDPEPDEDDNSDFVDKIERVDKLVEKYAGKNIGITEKIIPISKEELNKFQSEIVDLSENFPELQKFFDNIILIAKNAPDTFKEYYETILKIPVEAEK